MNRLWLDLLAAIALCAGAAFADTFDNGAKSFGIDFVTIRSLANPADTTRFPSVPWSVLCTYPIGKHEISWQVIAKANALGGLGTANDLRGSNEPPTSISSYEATSSVFYSLFLTLRGA
jgi:hypothetical protein